MCDVRFNRTLRWLTIMRSSEWRKRIPTFSTSEISDLANAIRVANPFEHPLVATPQGFFELIDDQWKSADVAVYREAAELGNTIKAEVKDFPWSDRGPGTSSDKARLRWARRSEMKPRIDAAVEMLRHLLAVDNLDQVRID
jgi:hypothetical protein